MQGNKGQYDENFVGMQVKAKKHGLCTVIHQMNAAEYEKSGKDYNRYFTLEDASGKHFECGRRDFTIPKK